MFKRFLSGSTHIEEIKNVTYRNSRILVLRNEANTTLPFEARIDFSLVPGRFKNAADAMAHAMTVVDASREALYLEQQSDGAVPV